MLGAIHDFGRIRHIHRDIGTVPELRYYIDKWLLKRYATY